MSDSTKIGVILFIVWLLGFVWLSTTSHYIDSDTRMLYLTAPVWVPFALIGFFQVMAWLAEGASRLARQIDRFKH